MLDDMFSFIDPIIELGDDDTSFVIQAEAFFDFMEKIGLDKAARSPAGGKVEIPIDIALSLLRPDELEKLSNYVTAYLAKHGGGGTP